MPERFEAQIRLLPLFAQLPQQQLNWAQEAMRIMRFEPGELVFQQGEEAKGLYMFLMGQGQLIRVEADGQQRVLGMVGVNQYLNEAALFKAGRETASLHVLQTATVLFVSRQQLWRVVSYHPEMKEYLPIPVEAAKERQREKIFRGQRESEVILLDVRRHWWTLVQKAWLPVGVFLTAMAAAAFLPVPVLSVVCGGVGLIFPGALLLYNYLEWRNDHVIITDQRIIRIEQVIHSFEEHRSEVPLSSVQQINADMITADPFSRVFNYGTVDIRTAGDAGNLQLTIMPDPDGIQNLIFENRNRYVEQAEREHRNTIKAEIDKIIGQQDNVPAAKQEEDVKIDNAPRGLLAMQYNDAQGNTVYRKHVMYWLWHIIPPGGLMVAALGLVILNLGAGAMILAAVLGVVALLWFWWADWDWRHDMYIVGDEMIQLIHKRPLFLQNEDDQILLDRVDNVTATKSGLLRAIFNYGTVTIALVGGDRGDEKVFKAVPRPAAVQEEITRRQQRWRSRQRTQGEQRRREEISEYLSAYHEQLQQRGGIPQNPNPTTRPPNVPRQLD